ncbi:MAG: hypothetical protein LBC02_12885 [Planctomycetaceae bacterium]|jgi:hypothetical protein|nr:hypothetical protein [Planctomycetaceae bacterium]
MMNPSGKICTLGTGICISLIGSVAGALLALSLVKTWRTAPYLYDGRYTNMKDLFKKGKHGDVEGKY